MKRLFFLLTLIVVLMMGCTHSLRITNEETFIPSNTKPSKADGLVKSQASLMQPL
ncbi:MAG: hypothetical protein WC649_06745 [Desulfobacteria bacterium]